MSRQPTPGGLARATGAGLCAALAWACAGHAPRSRAHPPYAVPPGCEQNLAGTYVWQANPSFRYLGEDDGGTLTLNVRRESLDGGTSNVPDPGNTRVVLTRTWQGFTGQTLSTQPNDVKAPCPVAFPTQLTACDRHGLTVRTAERIAIDTSCHLPAGGVAPSWTTERLLKVPSLAPPDAG